MYTLQKFVSITMLLAASTTVNAQWYGELDYVSATIKFSNTNSTVKSTPKSIGAFIGYKLTENYAAEFLIGRELGGTDVKVNGSSQVPPVTAKIDYLYGTFLKPSIKLGDAVDVYARLGYIKGSTTSSTSSASSTDVKGDWSYGIGANYYFGKTTYVTASWMNLYRKDGVKSDGLLVGLGTKF